MKLVLIEWVDSHSGRGWQPLNEIEAMSELLYCRTVGWVLSETKDVIHIVSTVSGERNKNIIECGSCTICIPKVSILKKRIIKQ